MRQFPEGLPPWLRRPTTVEELAAFYQPEDGEWHGPPPGEWEPAVGHDTYLSLERNVELCVSHEDDMLEREEHDEAKFILSHGPGMVPPNADHHFASENWEFVLEKMAEWGLLSPA